jgi:hypothetical protein
LPLRVWGVGGLGFVIMVWSMLTGEMGTHNAPSHLRRCCSGVSVRAVVSTFIFC